MKLRAPVSKESNYDASADRAAKSIEQELKEADRAIIPIVGRKRRIAQLKCKVRNEGRKSEVKSTRVGTSMEETSTVPDRVSYSQGNSTEADRIGAQKSIDTSELSSTDFRRTSPHSVAIKNKLFTPVAFDAGTLLNYDHDQVGAVERSLFEK